MSPVLLFDSLVNIQYVLRPRGFISEGNEIKYIFMLLLMFEKEIILENKISFMKYPQIFLK